MHQRGHSEVDLVVEIWEPEIVKRSGGEVVRGLVRSRAQYLGMAQSPWSFVFLLSQAVPLGLDVSGRLRESS